jgi:hypothetical protein
MQSYSLAEDQLSAVPLHSGERRKNRRFAMHFSVFLRALGNSWAACETADVSAAGASFVTDRPFLLSTPIEYVLTFPVDLTKAPQPLRVRFFATVLRCERVPDSNSAFGIAVRNTAHRYLNREESASYDEIAHKLSTTPNATASIQPHKAGI